MNYAHKLPDQRKHWLLFLTFASQRAHSKCDQCFTSQQPPMMSGLLNPFTLVQSGGTMAPGASVQGESAPVPVMPAPPDGNALLAMLQRPPSGTPTVDFSSHAAVQPVPTQAIVQIAIPAVREHPANKIPSHAWASKPHGK
jgi:hypothetical protein